MKRRVDEQSEMFTIAWNDVVSLEWAISDVRERELRNHRNTWNPLDNRKFLCVTSQHEIHVTARRTEPLCLIESIHRKPVCTRNSPWMQIINLSSFFFPSPDGRAKEFPFMFTPLPTVAFVLLYLSWVLVIGPLYMRDRKPYSLKNTLIVYNAFQVLLSAYMFYEVSKIYFIKSRNLTFCEEKKTHHQSSLKQLITAFIELWYWKHNACIFLYLSCSIWCRDGSRAIALHAPPSTTRMGLSREG